MNLFRLLLLILVISLYGLNGKSQLKNIHSLNLNDYWIFIGDSETDGRATETPDLVSQAVAFKNIFEANFPTHNKDILIQGVGGRSLLETSAYFETISDRDTATFVHFQESGNQDNNGQRTASQYAATFESFIRKIHSDSPDAIISTETAYSFEREHLDYRNWSDYNDSLYSVVDKLSNEGIKVYVANIDSLIKELVNSLGFSNVITTDGGHFLGVGNLLVALAIFHSLEYDINSLDLSFIDDATVSNSNKQLCKSIILGNLTNESNNIRKLDFNISPNPATDFIQIDYSLSSESEPYYVRIYNYIGKEVFHKEINTNLNTLTISTSHISAGIYFLCLQTKKGICKKNKIVILE